MKWSHLSNTFNLLHLSKDVHKIQSEGRGLNRIQHNYSSVFYHILYKKSDNSTIMNFYEPLAWLKRRSLFQCCHMVNVNIAHQCFEIIILEEQYRKAFIAGCKILHIRRRYVVGHSLSVLFHLSFTGQDVSAVPSCLVGLIIWDLCLDTAMYMFISRKRCRPEPLLFTLWACLLREIHHSSTLNKADRRMVTDRHTVWVGNEDGTANLCFLLLLDHHHRVHYL